MYADVNALSWYAILGWISIEDNINIAHPDVTTHSQVINLCPQYQMMEKCWLLWRYSESSLCECILAIAIYTVCT